MSTETEASLDDLISWAASDDESESNKARDRKKSDTKESKGLSDYYIYVIAFIIFAILVVAIIWGIGFAQKTGPETELLNQMNQSENIIPPAIHDYNYINRGNYPLNSGYPAPYYNPQAVNQSYQGQVYQGQPPMIQAQNLASQPSMMPVQSQPNMTQPNMTQPNLGNLGTGVRSPLPSNLKPGVMNGKTGYFYTPPQNN